LNTNAPKSTRKAVPLAFSVDPTTSVTVSRFSARRTQAAISVNSAPTPAASTAEKTPA